MVCIINIIHCIPYTDILVVHSTFVRRSTLCHAKGTVLDDPPLPPTQTNKECFLTTTYLLSYMCDIHKNVKMISFPFRRSVTSCGRVAARRGVYDVRDS